VTELVDIWVVPLERSDAEVRALVDVLSPEERDRAGTLPLGPRKRRYVARQAALRSILAERVGTPPDRLPLVRTVRGKPTLAGHQHVRFSVSDSGDLALVALARRDVGVDVERVRDRTAATRAAALGIDRFFERWTQLEATGKARGSGLLGRGGDDGLTCTAIDVGPGYAAAVAVAAEGVEVRLRPYS
jgi:4'-phosphopantetheinyl transferase